LHIFFSHIYPYNTTLSIPLIIKSIKLKNNVTIATIVTLFLSFIDLIMRGIHKVIFPTSNEVKQAFISVIAIVAIVTLFLSFIDLIMRGILKVVL